jgi:hypothetical protein
MAEKVIESKKSCIWMDAGVVQFKLCDSDFDCLSCQFDRAMTEAATKHQARRELERKLQEKGGGSQTLRILCSVDGKRELKQVL